MLCRNERDQAPFAHAERETGADLVDEIRINGQQIRPRGEAFGGGHDETHLRFLGLVDFRNPAGCRLFTNCLQVHLMLRARNSEMWF